MGRKKKFGEESDFVSVRVPKSKRKEYRNGIKDFVEKKIASESDNKSEESKIRINKTELDGFRKFEEFIKDFEKEVKEKEDNMKRE